MYFLTRLHCKESYCLTVSVNLCSCPKIRQMPLPFLTKYESSQLGFDYWPMPKIQNSCTGVLLQITLSI